MTKNQRLGEKCKCRHKYDKHEMESYYPYRLAGCTRCDCKKFEEEGIRLAV